jgi:SAM-dependent methyltransferase
MLAAEYTQMARLESTHWYFQGKRAIVRSFLRHAVGLTGRPRILDVGCGTGRMLAMMGEFGGAYGLDHSPMAIESCRGLEIRQLVRGDASKPFPFQDASFDVVCAYDVLEHLEDESALLDEMRRVLKPGGALVITVPALPFLWSAHDEALGHYRRYTRADVQRVLSSRGFVIRRLTYFNTILFPLACAVRLAARWTRSGDEPRSDFFVSLPALLNAVLRTCFSAERAVIRHVDLPVGLSLLCFATR